MATPISNTHNSSPVITPIGNDPEIMVQLSQWKYSSSPQDQKGKAGAQHRQSLLFVSHGAVMYHMV